MSPVALELLIRLLKAAVLISPVVNARTEASYVYPLKQYSLSAQTVRDGRISDSIVIKLPLFSFAAGVSFLYCVCRNVRAGQFVSVKKPSQALGCSGFFLISPDWCVFCIDLILCGLMASCHSVRGLMSLFFWGGRGALRRQKRTDALTASVFCIIR